MGSRDDDIELSPVGGIGFPHEDPADRLTDRTALGFVVGSRLMTSADALAMHNVSGAGQQAGCEASTARTRNLLLDALRLFAIVAIVWQHTPESALLKPYAALSYFAVPFFVLSAVVLVFEGVRRNPSRSVFRYATNRFKRIYIPFLIWTAIYLVARDSKQMLLTHRPVISFQLPMLIEGSAHHLWFLPYILVVTVVTYAVAKVCVRRTALLVSISLLAAMIGSVVGFLPRTLFAWDFLLDRAWNMTPSALWGFALGGLYPFIPERVWRIRWLTGAGILGCAASSALAMTPYESVFSDNFGGLGLLLIALVPREPSPTLQRLARLGGLAFGVYLCHVLFLEGLQAVAARRGVVGHPWLDLCVFVASLITSLLISLYLSRQRWGRWLVP